MKYKTTASMYKIIIFNQTRMFEVFHDTFPHLLYEFKPFIDLAIMEQLGEAPMFDVIGTIVSHYRPLTREINGKLTKLMDLVLEDLEGNTITATLWEKHAEEIINFLNSAPTSPVVIILQFCRPNIYRGEVRISSLFNITKIVTNQSISEISEFSNNYLTSGKVKSTSISTLTSSSTRSLHDEIKDGDFVLKTISEIMTDGEVGNFWVFASILCVETIGDWSYLACKRCQKKMRASGSQFFCEKCQSYDITGKLRYKLTVRVVDDTGTTTFLLWDKESVALIGKTALELSVGPSVEGIPAGIEQLANKKALFNVAVQPGQTRNYTGSFSVVKISTDREVILKVCGENVIEDEASASINGAELNEEMIGSSSSKNVGGSRNTDVSSKTIQQILEDGQAGEFTVFATVNSIEDINAMSYLACKVCKQELDPHNGLKFFCEKCESYAICGITRYKLTVEVGDGTATTRFYLWENQCIELLGKNSMKTFEDDVPDMLPTRVEGISTKKGLFNVVVLPEQVKNFNGPFDVVKVEAEDSIVGEATHYKDSQSKSKKGKEVIDDITGEEILLGATLLTPNDMTANNTNAVNILENDHVKRNLMDEFSATTQKRNKRLTKKDKM